MLLKEAIRPIQPKTSEQVSVFGRKLTAMDLFQHFTSNPEEKRWSFNTGNPEFWKFSSKLIVTGGTALDLGSELGKTSVHFALRGMRVTAYETNPDFARALCVTKENFNLPISVLNEDITTADFGEEAYDTVLLDQVFAHFRSREEAFKVTDKAIKALKKGGHIWFRGNGPGFDGLEQQASSFDDSFDPFLDTQVYDSDQHYLNTCYCSGQERLEPHLFFDPLELVHQISKSGINIVHAQMVPERGKVNIVFGANWGVDRNQFDEKVNMGDLLNGALGESAVVAYRGDDIITIIGQKT